MALSGIFFAPGAGPCHRDLTTIGNYSWQMPSGAPGTGPCHRDLTTIGNYSWQMPPGTGTGPCRGDLSTIGNYSWQMPPGTGTGPCHRDLSTIGNYSPPFKNLKINGRIIGDFDIFFCHRKCQKWNIRSLNLSKKLVVTRNE